MGAKQSVRRTAPWGALGRNDDNSLHVRIRLDGSGVSSFACKSCYFAVMAAFGCRRHRCAHASLCARTNCPTIIALEMATRDIRTRIGQRACPSPLIAELCEGARQWVG